MPYPKEQLHYFTQPTAGADPPPSPVPPLTADTHSKTQRECTVMRSLPSVSVQIVHN